MPCDTRRKPNQTIEARKLEITDVVKKLAADLASGKAKAIVGPQGAVAFQGFQAGQQAGVTDACAYRRLLTAGSPLALMAIQKAELLAGRKVDKQQVALGAHSHDNGMTWHSHKG